MEELQSIEWIDGKVRLLDQSRLPGDYVMLQIADHRGLVNAINRLGIRGAPALGIAAAYGVVLSIWNLDESDRAAFLEMANKAIDELKATRPTARNLFWALERMRKTLTRHLNLPLLDVKKALLREAQRIHEDDIERCRKIGRHGAQLLPIRASVLTHCNAGALATGGYGTALGIIRAAVEMGKKVSVYAGETRPLFQGARLTAFELLQLDISVTLICDSAAASVMKKGLVNCVVVGADRITCNGDVANKIGTYSLAVLARQHGIPFYVAAPLSTFDFDLKSGDEIPIEERDAREITRVGNLSLAPAEVAVYNPAFDVTPGALIDAIVTEAGVIGAPYDEAIAALKNKS